MRHDIGTRRRRAAWRASHRGTKELDLLIGRYAETKLPLMNESELSHFESFLNVSDPKLAEWLLAPGPVSNREYADLIVAVREFHGLK